MLLIGLEVQIFKIPFGLQLVLSAKPSQEADKRSKQNTYQQSQYKIFKWLQLI